VPPEGVLRLQDKIECGCYITSDLVKMIDELIAKGLHKSRSEFLRKAAQNQALSDLYALHLKNMMQEFNKIRKGGEKKK
jgi:hypothetical protein